ncbi:hypothetical protein, partial [Acinetobacter lactucae]|uniref:hypothetical protein n=1 Tax=Acinetobacter lactucae TaxID=1785128 RepID=UPI001BB3B0CF
YFLPYVKNYLHSLNLANFYYAKNAWFNIFLHFTLLQNQATIHLHNNIAIFVSVKTDSDLGR